MNKEKRKHYLKLFSFPLLFFGFFLTLDILWRVFDLPSDEATKDYIRGWFVEYGMLTMFFGGMLEGVLLVGNYFPGVVVIFIGVVLAESIPEAAFVVGIATAGLMLAHITNYYLGKYGWYKLLVKFGLKSSIENSREKLIEKGPIAIFLSYWMPSMSALVDTAAGIMRLPFKTFIKYSLLGAIFWNTLVGAIVYILGDTALKIASPGGNTMPLISLIAAIWIAIILVLEYRKKKKANQSI